MPKDIIPVSETKPNEIQLRITLINPKIPKKHPEVKEAPPKYTEEAKEASDKLLRVTSVKAEPSIITELKLSETGLGVVKHLLKNAGISGNVYLDVDREFEKKSRIIHTYASFRTHGMVVTVRDIGVNVSEDSTAVRAVQKLIANLPRDPSKLVRAPVKKPPTLQTDVSLPHSTRGFLENLLYGSSLTGTVRVLFTSLFDGDCYSCQAAMAYAELADGQVLETRAFGSTEIQALRRVVLQLVEENKK